MNLFLLIIVVLGSAQVREGALLRGHLHDGLPGAQCQVLLPAVRVHVARRGNEEEPAPRAQLRTGKPTRENKEMRRI